MTSNGDSDSESESSWKTDAIEKATDKLRSELEKESQSSSGKKSEALQKAKEYVDKVEETLKKKA